MVQPGSETTNRLTLYVLLRQGLNYLFIPDIPRKTSERNTNQLRLVTEGLNYLFIPHIPRKTSEQNINQLPNRNYIHEDQFSQPTHLERNSLGWCCLRRRVLSRTNWSFFSSELLRMATCLSSGRSMDRCGSVCVRVRIEHVCMHVGMRV